MGAFTEIRSALSGRLAILNDSPVVAWENAEFKRTNEIEYIAEFFLPGDTVQAGGGKYGVNSEIGTYQINVMTPKTKGWGRAIDVADAVADHFPRGLYLPYGDVVVRIGDVSIGNSLTEDLFYSTPVKIRYNLFTKPRGI